MKYFPLSITGLLLMLSNALQAQTIDPEGLYQNTFSGGISGTELILIRAVADQDGLYKISNVQGRGYLATIKADGQISIETYGVVGGFSSQDSAQFSISGGQPSQYQLTRIALTDPDFLDNNDQSVAVNPLYVDKWDGTEHLFDLVTGNELVDPPAFLFTSILTAETTDDGDEGLRSTEFIGIQLNGYFQGVMQSHRDYVVQIGDPLVQQLVTELAMQTIPGSETGFSVRFIGRGQFEDINTFKNTIVVENRRFNPQPPQVKISLFQQTLRRQEPLVAGDFDANGQVGESDREQIKSLYGLDDSRDDYNLLADIDNNGVIDLRDSSALDGSNTETVNIDAGFSGSWFNTGRSGEGWNLAVLPNNLAIVAFFTYSPDGSKQSWAIGVGQIEGNEIVFTDLEITSGAVFGDQFDPNDVVRNNWGGSRIYFTDCNNGAISYAANGAFDNNARPISRLTSLAGLECGQSPGTADASQTLSGSWFLPERDGEGVILEALPDGRVVMYWYTYDSEGGHQYWLSGVGEYDNVTHSAQFDMLTTTSGTAFGDDFVSSDVNFIPWGSASFVQTGCDDAVFSFNSSIAAFGSGSHPLIRLTGVDTLDCDADQFSR